MAYPINYAGNISLNNNEIQNVVLQKLAADPTNITAKIYYNTVSNAIKFYNGSTWVALGSGAGDVIGPASSVDGQIALFDLTTGKLIKAATTTGMLKATSGVLSAASAGTDYLAPAAIGTTVQAYDATLAALAGLNATAGVLVQTAADTFTKRTLTGTTNRIVITNGDGVSGNPTFDIGSDVVTAASSHSFTNKTFDANGTGNSISNLEVADFTAAAIVTVADTIAANNNDTTIPTSAAVKAYADGILAANDGFTFEGGIDCSTNPNYPAADAGHVYKVTVAGKIGGGSGIDVQVGDTLYCTVDASASGTQAAVGANWTIVQANVDRATTTTLGLAEYADSTEAEAKSSTLVAVTPAALVNFPVKKTFTIGDTVATSFALTHNLGTKDIVVSVRKVSTDEQWITDVTATSTTQATVSFSVAPSTNEFVVTIIG